MLKELHFVKPGHQIRKDGKVYKSLQQIDFEPEKGLMHAVEKRTIDFPEISIPDPESDDPRSKMDKRTAEYKAWKAEQN